MHIKKQTIKQNKIKQNKNRLVHEGIYVQFYYFFKFKIYNCWGIRNQVKWEFHKTSESESESESGVSSSSLL